MNNEDVKHGVVQWFNENRGFGMLFYPVNPGVGDEEYATIFVHRLSVIGKPRLSTLVRGEKVSFKIGSYRNRPTAISVVRLNDGGAQ